MTGPFFFGVGGVVSADIAVPEHERELAFYSNVLTTGSSPLWREDLSNSDGTPIIGLGPRPPEYDALPLQWMPHIQVADVAASVDATVELGGQELMHGKDDDGQSQWAVLVDPAGAAFGVIPVAVAPSDGTMQGPRGGRITGLSLVADDLPDLCEFYTRVVGWTASPASAAGTVAMQRPESGAVAHIVAVDASNRELAGDWLIGLPVGDLEQSLKNVGERGGDVLGEVAGTGHTAIRDPLGILFSLRAD